MRRLIAIWLFLAASNLFAAHVQFPFTDSRLNALGARQLTLYPIAVTDTNSGKIVTKDKVVAFTGTNSTVTVSNQLDGFYKVVFHGPFTQTTNLFVFPATNGVINAADWVANYYTNGNQVYIYSAATAFSVSGGSSGGSGNLTTAVTNQWRNDISATNAAMLAGLASTGSVANASYATNIAPIFTLGGSTVTKTGDQVDFGGLTLHSDTISGDVVVAPSIVGAFTGNGSGLTNLNADNLASGTLPQARLPTTTYPNSSYGGVGATGGVVTASSITASGNIGSIAGTVSATTISSSGTVRSPQFTPGTGQTSTIIGSATTATVTLQSTNINVTGTLAGNGAGLTNLLGADATTAERDGTTDATAKLQADINRITAAGGGMLILPPGTYKLSSALTITNTIILQGSGEATILAPAGNYGDIIKINPAATPSTSSTQFLFGVQLRDFYVRPAANRTSGAVINSKFTHGAVFSNLRFGSIQWNASDPVYCYDGILLTNQSAAVVQGCHINAKHYGIVFTGYGDRPEGGGISALGGLVHAGYWSGTVNLCNLWGDKATTDSVGILIGGGCGGIATEQSNISFFWNGIETRGTNREVFIGHETWLDNNSNKGLWVRSNTVSLKLYLNGCWAAGNGEDGMTIERDLGTVLIRNVYGYNNFGNGLFLNGASATISDTAFTGSTDGLDFKIAGSIGALTLDDCFFESYCVTNTHVTTLQSSNSGELDYLPPLNGMVMWLDNGALVGEPDGTLLTDWGDRSTNNVHAMAHGNFAPYITNRDGNIYACFNSEKYMTNSALSLPSDSFTIALLARPEANGASFLRQSGGALGVVSADSVVPDSYAIPDDMDTAANTTPLSPAGSITNKFRVFIICGGSPLLRHSGFANPSLFYRLNDGAWNNLDVSGWVDAPGTFSWAVDTMGGRTGSLPFSLGGVIIYNRRLSVTEANKVAEYFNHQFGLW